MSVMCLYFIQFWLSKEWYAQIFCKSFYPTFPCSSWSWGSNFMSVSPRVPMSCLFLTCLLSVSIVICLCFGANCWVNENFRIINRLVDKHICVRLKFRIHAIYRDIYLYSSFLSNVIYYNNDSKMFRSCFSTLEKRLSKISCL